MICLSQRDNADYVSRAFRENHDRNPALNHPYSEPSFFPIFAGIGLHQKKAAKHFLRIREVKSMFTYTAAVLCFIPLEL
jgi:hypothetical protein